MDKMTLPELRVLLDASAVKRHDLYQHYNGGLYVIENLAIQESTQEPVVIYRPAWSDVWFTRTLQNFVEAVEVDGISTPRFKLIP